MKTQLILTIGGVLAFLPAEARADLNVHEWGTFTILEGTDGVALEWYQAQPELVELPDFARRPVDPAAVNQPVDDQSLTKNGPGTQTLAKRASTNSAKVTTFTVAGKSGTARAYLPGSTFKTGVSSLVLAGGTFGTGSATRMDNVRMETPVLYFYPDKTMDITVEASLTGGRITEVFPPATTTAGTATWRGTLVPPGADGRALVPAANGPRASQYAAARQVPDAWLFKGQPVAGVEASVKAVEPVEHFIFYRGAGSRPQFEISAVPSLDGNALTVTNDWSAEMPMILALRVENGMSCWTVQEQLATGPQDQRTLSFPTLARPAKEVAVQLRHVMTEALTRQGLTPAESAAMVATWDDLWFTDPGTRLLIVLPQSFADTMVPLKITPQPASISRVYVGRLELFSKEQEEALVALLSEPDATQDREAARRRLNELHLGRYAAGGMERASALMTAAMHARFTRLSVDK